MGDKGRSESPHGTNPGAIHGHHGGLDDLEDDTVWSLFERTVLSAIDKQTASIDVLAGDVRSMAERVTSLEHHRTDSRARQEEKAKVWTYVLGILAVVLAALLLSFLRLK